MIVLNEYTYEDHTPPGTPVMGLCGMTVSGWGRAERRWDIRATSVRSLSFLNRIVYVDRAAIDCMVLAYEDVNSYVVLLRSHWPLPTRVRELQDSPRSSAEQAMNWQNMELGFVFGTIDRQELKGVFERLSYPVVEVRWRDLVDGINCGAVR